MDAVLASLLAPFSSPISSKFDQSITKQSEKNLGEPRTTAVSAATPSLAPVPPPGAGEDRVTILGTDGLSQNPRPTVDLSGLFSLGTGSAAPDGAANTQNFFEGVFSSAAAFSFQASFSSLTVESVSGRGSHGIGRLLQNLDTAFQDLLAFDPAQGKRLGILARMLAVLNPEISDKLLKTIHDSIRSLAGLGQSAPRNAPLPPPAAFQTSPETPTDSPPPATQIITEMVHFELDFEMEMTSTVRFAIGEMRAGGIDVWTVEIQSSQRVQIHIEFMGIRQKVRQSDPLVLDLAGNGIDLTGIENGANFDIDADGKTDRTAFVQGDDAFLALDRNGNGRIDDGSELFGDQHGARNGFEELRRFDVNHDSRIDARDPVFSSLRLLHDINGDGRVATHELSTLLDQGIQSIELDYLADRSENDGRGNTLAERSAYVREDGSKGELVDAWIGYADRFDSGSI